jgi:uncharacterized protein (DUF433 family)
VVADDASKRHALWGSLRGVLPLRRTWSTALGVIEAIVPPSFTVNGFLTETKLAEIISALAPTGFVPQFKLDGFNYRWDFKYETRSERVLVEYDGDEHYRNTTVIRVDRAKGKLAVERGFRTFSFPYWLQLDAFTLKHFFGFYAHIVQDFPHGFITTKLFPASFCELGVERFREEFSRLPSQLQQAVVKSLRERADKYGLEYVLPTKLRAMLAWGTVRWRPTRRCTGPAIAGFTRFRGPVISSVGRLIGDSGSIWFMIDWSTCPAVEREPELVNGAWVFRGTRVPVAALFENLEDGALVSEFVEWFPGVTIEQARAVLEHAARSALAPA